MLNLVIFTRVKYWVWLYLHVCDVECGCIHTRVMLTVFTLAMSSKRLYCASSSQRSITFLIFSVSLLWTLVAMFCLSTAHHCFKETEILQDIRHCFWNKEKTAVVASAVLSCRIEAILLICVVLLFFIYIYTTVHTLHDVTFHLSFMIKLKISCWVNDLTKVNQTVSVSKCTGHCAEARSRAFQSSELRDSGVVISPWTHRDLCVTI